MKPILAFVAIAYGFSLALSLLVWLSGGYDSPLIGLRYVFRPAIAVSVIDRTLNEKLRERFRSMSTLGAGFLSLFVVGGLLLFWSPTASPAPRVSLEGVRS